MLGVEEAFGKAVEALVPRAVDSLTSAWKRRSVTKEALDQASQSADKAIRRHLKFVSKWASQIKVLGFSEPYSTSKGTVPLSIAPFARTITEAGGSKTTFDDVELLGKRKGHLLILGLPGSGKTTTLKRLAMHMFFGDPAPNDDLSYPLLIRLRDLPYRTLRAAAIEEDTTRQQLRQSWLLLKEIARVLGLEYQDAIERDQAGSPLRVVTTCAGGEIQDVIPEILDDSEVLLLLDGVDELHPAELDFVVDEISRLTLSLDRSRLVLTSRTGMHERTINRIEGVSVFRIDPLSRNQITEVARFWVEDVSDFLVKLDSEPYSDVADRPLVLLQLLFVFKRYSYLPDRPAEAYRQSIQLLLKEWNAAQGIKRTSRYSAFTPGRKLDFLCDLAHDLTSHGSGTATFSRSHFASSYRNICEAYELPKDEAEVVAAEIETHTGILVKVGFDRYEFSHLSLQEYLAAEYLIKARLGPRIKVYIRNAPAALAVAVGLSSTPSEWLPDILLDTSLLSAFSKDTLEDFLKRMRVERPKFVPSMALGIAASQLAATYYGAARDVLRREIDSFLQLKAVESSVVRALQFYKAAHDPFADDAVISFRRQRAEAAESGSRRRDALDLHAYELGLSFPDRIALPLQEVVRLNREHELGIEVSNLGKESGQGEGGPDLAFSDERYPPHNVD